MMTGDIGPISQDYVITSPLYGLQPVGVSADEGMRAEHSHGQRAQVAPGGTQ